MTRLNTTDTLRHAVFLTMSILVLCFLTALTGGLSRQYFYVPLALVLVWTAGLYLWRPPAFVWRWSGFSVYTFSSIVIAAGLVTGVPVGFEQLAFAYLYRLDLATGLSLWTEIPTVFMFVYPIGAGLLLWGPGPLKLRAIVALAVFVCVASGILFSLEPDSKEPTGPVAAKVELPARTTKLELAEPAKSAAIQTLEHRHFILVILEGIRWDTFYSELEAAGGLGAPHRKPAPFFTTMPFTNAGWFSLLHGRYPRLGSHTIYDGNRPGLIGLFTGAGYKCRAILSTFSFKFAPSQVLTAAGCPVVFGDSPALQKYKPAEFHWGVDDRAAVREVESAVEAAKIPHIFIVGFSNTHFDYFVATNKPRYDTNSKYGRYRSAVFYTVELLQKMIRRILKTAPNAVIAVTSDHGESFGEAGFRLHGYSLHNAEIKVPMLLIGNQLPALADGEFYSHLDLFPTVADLFFGKPPEETDGRSWLRPAKPGRFLYLRSWWQAGQRGFIQAGRKTIFMPRKNAVVTFDVNGERLPVNVVPAGKWQAVDNVFGIEP